MTLDPTLKAFLDKLHLPTGTASSPDGGKGATGKGNDWQRTVDRLRAEFYRFTRSVESDAPELAAIETLVIDAPHGPMKARKYTPFGTGIGAQPLLIFFHGGGFVVGDLDGHEMICIRLAHAARCRVLSIDYRLAPEHCFPCAHDDAFAAWHWVVANADALSVDPTRIAIGGDSAGGNLAAMLCQELRRKREPMPAFQLLCYPLVQFVDIKTKRLSFQEGFFISEKLYEFFKGSYLSEGTDPLDPLISPLFAPHEDFRGLPPAHVLLCGWDPLQDEGRAYADKLAAAGVPVTLQEHPGMIHGFMNLTALSVPAREAIHKAGTIVGKALGSLD